LEHLIVLFVELGRWIDKRFQKPLRRALPDLDRLLQEPRGTLAGQTFTIGPARRYGSAFFLGLLLALVLTGLSMLLLYLTGALKRLQPGQHPELVTLLGAAGVALLVGSIWFVLGRLRGGEVVLGERGVEFRYRGSTVACPWALFNAAGQPFALSGNQLLLLPVSPRAVPYVELRREEEVKARGDQVKTRRIKFRSSTEAVLAPLYEVTLMELGVLLLQLGRALGVPLPDGSTAEDPTALAPAAGPPAQVGKDDWLTVRLTRLEFPPFCCDCGTPTFDGQEFQGHALVANLLGLKIESGEFASFRVPVCSPCQEENQRRFWKAVWKGLAFGLGVPVLLCVGLSLWAREPAVLFACIPLGIIGGLVGLLIGRTRGKRASRPVELERYSPSKGTIAVRFRWRAYGERLVAFLEAKEDLPYSMVPGLPRR
jgi:hypothetical protein